MKTITILFVCILISLQTKAQISLENTYPASSNNVQVFLTRLTKSGYKYAFADAVNNTLKLYNMNHSLFKTMSVPVPNGYSIYFGPAFVSDSLFNTDANVEYAVSFLQSNYTITPATYQSLTSIISENGTVITTIQQSRVFGVFNTGPNGWKLVAYVDSTNNMQLKEIKVYSLVGSMPSINNNNGTPTGNTQLDKQTPMLSNPFPNPSQNKVIIPYSCPAGTTAQLNIYDISGHEIKSYSIDSAFNTVELDNTDLPSGTYFYSISGTNGARKMIIIR